MKKGISIMKVNYQFVMNNKYNMAKEKNLMNKGNCFMMVFFERINNQAMDFQNNINTTTKIINNVKS